jgi:hypothetical protein
MNTDVFILDGRAYNWRKMCELRRQQIEASRAAHGIQPALFELHEDYRPACERSASYRYSGPSLFDQM